MADRLTVADVNLANYAHNISVVKSLLSDVTKIMAVIKANAYGHGIEEVAKAATAAGVEYLGVVSINEAKRIREFGIKSPILIMNYLDADSLHEAVALHSAVTVMDAAGIKAAETAAKKNSQVLDVHLKVDTGMHRAGCEPQEVTALARLISSSKHLRFEGLMGHFAESEVTDGEFTAQQLKVFQSCIKELETLAVCPPLIHHANSAAAISLPVAHFTMVRIGLITYGINPFEPTHPSYMLVEKKFRPVLTLKSQVVYLRNVKAGEPVGYNRSWYTTRPSKIALLPVGYGDGYRRGPQNAGYVLVRGKKAPIVGSVSMDQTTIDVTDIDDVAVGDEVVLIGQQGSQTMSAGDVAAQYGTIHYEVITSLSARIQREYRHPE